MKIGQLPRVLAGHLASSVSTAAERLVYRPSGPRRAAPSRAVRLPGFLHPSVASPDFGDRFRVRFPHDAAVIVDAADQAVKRRLRIRRAEAVDLDVFRRRTDLRAYPRETGFSPVALAQASLIPWHFDVNSGVAWPSHRFFTDLRWNAPGADPTAPWELSRCQHFVTLGQAYALTHDEVYAKAFSEQIDDWIRANPPKYGINWVSLSNIGLRAVNWLVAWELFHRSPSVSGVVKERLPGALWEHGRHLRSHAVRTPRSGTTDDLAGLLGLAAIARATGESEWWRIAHNEMVAGMAAQAYTDGFHGEASTADHRLALETVLAFSILATADDPGGTGSRAVSLTNSAGREFHDGFFRMGDVLLRLMDSEARVPLIGDNDSRRAFVLRSREDNDMGYLSDLATLFFGDERLRLRRPATSEGCWLFGLDAVETLEPLGEPPSAVPALTGEASGLATLRGPTDVLILLAQPNGLTGAGRHAHNDKLSLCLSVGRDVFLADPGTYLYSSAPEERNAFRCTGAHSTVQVDNEEQNDAQARIVERKEYRLSARHDGYRGLADPVIHRRSVERIESPLSWIIEDELDGGDDHGLRWRFVAGPAISVAADGSTARLVGLDGELEMSVHPATLRFHVESARLAPAYGVAVPTPVLSLSWRGKLPFRTTFTVVWRRRSGGDA